MARFLQKFEKENEGKIEVIRYFCSKRLTFSFDNCENSIAFDSMCYVDSLF